MVKANTGRIVLTEKAKVALSSMLEQIKDEGECIKITPSKLTSWLVERFAINYFPKDMELILKEHFNSKVFLRNVLKEIENEEDLASALNGALKVVKSKKPRKRKPRKSKGNENSPSSKDIDQSDQFVSQ